MENNTPRPTKILAPQLREKEKDELAWSVAFTEGINFIYRFDYMAEPYPDESSIIDTKAVSVSGQYPILDIQLTHDKEIDFQPTGQIKNVKFSREVLEEAINRKTAESLEKYSKQEVGNTILVIQGYMPRQWANKINNRELTQAHKDNAFKGIYYVVPPLTSEDGQIEEETGFVMPIKDCLSGI